MPGRSRWPTRCSPTWRRGSTKLIAGGHTPGLATVLIGDDEPSARYVGMKMQKAEELGCNSPHVHLPADATTEQAIEAVQALNADPAVDAMLVQYPAPPQVDFDAVLLAVDPDKDVDGMHPTNVGRLALGIPGPVACTPAGIEALLAHYEVPVAGRDVVIVGRGVTIGRPLSILLSQKRPTANAAVTVVHTGVPDWAEHTRRADILVAAAGVPGMIQPEHIKPGGVVVGAGVQYEGRKLLPDVDEACEEVAGWITPRVGGVGPDHDRPAVPQLRRGRRAPRQRGLMPGTLTALPADRDPGPQVLGARLGQPPDADHDPPRRRARPASRGTTRPGPRSRPTSTTWRPSGTPAPRPQRDAVVTDALDRGVGDRGGDVCLELGSGIGAYTPQLAQRWRRVLATEVSLEMLRLRPARRRAPRARRRRAAPAGRRRRRRGRPRQLLPVPRRGRSGAGARRAWSCG